MKSQKGWLQEYLSKREQLTRESSNLDESVRGVHPDQTLYAIIQPTGIMYGHPVSGDSEDKLMKTKVSLMECLLSSYILVKDSVGDSVVSINDTYRDAVDHIARFYNTVYPELYKSSKSLFRKKREGAELLEKILSKRIAYETDGDFWSSFFHNSLLFLDIYFFRQWIIAGGDDLVVNFLKGQKDLLRLDVIKVMAVAAYSNRIIEPEERQMFGHLIDSLKLPTDKRDYAIEYFEKGTDIDDAPVPQEDTWILKKYLFEIAILTTWADRKIEESEEHFLKEYNQKLGFPSAEFDKSMLAVEGFVLEYWHEFVSLNRNASIETVGVEFKFRLSEVISAHGESITNEIKKRSGTVEKIRLAKAGELDEEEKVALSRELVEVLQSIPALEITQLPKRYLNLKILMEIFPDNFFSGF